MLMEVHARYVILITELLLSGLGGWGGRSIYRYNFVFVKFD